MLQVSGTETAAKIAQLASLTIKDLRREWSLLFGTVPPAAARQDYLARAIAYRMQADLYGGLSSATLRRLKKLCVDMTADPENASVAKPMFKSGTRILREWHGEMHEAIVVSNGFLYNGETYKSLSMIARKITGTRWSGPVFFGLKRSQNNNPEDLDKATKAERALTIKRRSTSSANAMVAES